MIRTAKEKNLFFGEKSRNYNRPDIKWQNSRGFCATPHGSRLISLYGHGFDASRFEPPQPWRFIQLFGDAAGYPRAGEHVSAIT
jgi:hypothetical protein